MDKPVSLQSSIPGTENEIQQLENEVKQSQVKHSGDNFFGESNALILSEQSLDDRNKKVELTESDENIELLKSSSRNLYDELQLVPQSFVDSLFNNGDNALPVSSIDNIQDSSNSDKMIDSQLEKHDLIKCRPNSSGLNEQASSSQLNSENSISCESSDQINTADLRSNWRMLTGIDGSYYWNVDTGATQFEAPYELKESTSENNDIDSLDSSLTDLEGAAFRYASLHIKDDRSPDQDRSPDWTVSSDTGTMFSVQSLGWLPLRHFSTDPETSSSEVNACIKHLSSSHGQLMDGIGAWGEGKDLMLLIEDEYLKFLDPSSQAVLQTQPIKHIRIWGVGGSSPHDFAYVARDNVTRQYKCHVFRCDAAAKAIAQELHNVFEKLSSKNKQAVSDFNVDKIEKEKIALSTNMPMPKAEAVSEFSVKYLGTKSVQSVNGIHTIKNVIRDITTSDTALCEDCIATITASAFIISRKADNDIIVNCRMRCLSFMGIGDDISLFAFIHVVGNEINCYVLQCQPNAVKIALAVQEACVLRFQKAIDSKPVSNENKAELPRRKSFKQYFKNVFARRSTSGE